MKFTVVMKCPSGLDEPIEKVVAESLSDRGLDDDERGDLRRALTDEINDALAKWVKFGEYVTIEFDTDADTAIVVPR